MASGQAGYHALIEAGGTKFVLGIARDEHTILATHRIETRHPEVTLPDAIAWFQGQAEQGGFAFDSCGIASFGPLCLDTDSPQWGHIVRTPKPGWANTPLARIFADALQCPVAIDTDVNGAALAEYHWGAGQGKRAVIYITIGTGVGGGLVLDGRIARGISHPEMGHMRMARHGNDDYAGFCTVHGDCLEGMACGPAIIDRWGASLSDLPADHQGRDIIAHYLAEAVVTMQAMIEPDCIVIGGGVSATPGLLETVASLAAEKGRGYFVGDPNTIITAPALGDRAGLLGAYALTLSL